MRRRDVFVRLRLRRAWSRCNRVTGVVILSYLAISLFFMGPTLNAFSSRILGVPGDSTGSVYDIWALRTYGPQVIGHFDLYLIGRPFGYVQNNLPWLTSSGLIVPAWILRFIFDEVIVYNLLVFTGIFFTAVSGFVAGKWLNLDPIPSWWIGFVATILPFHQLSAGSWYSLTHLQALPLSIAAGFLVLTSPSWRSWRRLGGVVLIGVVTNGYVGLMCVLLAVIVSLVAAIRLVANHRKGALRYASYGLFLVSVLVFWLQSRYQILNVGVTRTAEELAVYGLRISELYRPSIYSASSLTSLWRIRPNPQSDFHMSNPVETSHYLGVSLLAISVVLSAIVVLCGSKKSRWMWVWTLSVALAAVWIAMSQGASVLGLSLPKPSDWITSFLPAWRVYSRFGIVAGICVGFIGAIGLHEIGRRIKTGKSRYVRLGAALVLAASVVLVFDDLRTQFPNQSFDLDEPSYVRHLDESSDKTILLLPIVRTDNPHWYDQRLPQREHQIPLVNGFVEHSRQQYFQYSLGNPANERLASLLSLYRISTVVIDKVAGQYSDQSLANVRQTLSVVFEDDRYIVARSQQNDDASHGWFEGDMGPVEYKETGSSWRWLLGNNSIALTASESACYEVAFDIPQGDQSTVSILSIIDPESAAIVGTIEAQYSQRIFVQLSRGFHTLRLIPNSHNANGSPEKTYELYASDIIVTQADSARC